MYKEPLTHKLLYFEFVELTLLLIKLVFSYNLYQWLPAYKQITIYRYHNYF